MTAIVRVADAHKTFGETVALGGVSLDVNTGECVGLLGPNGAGKTTLLSLLLGLRAPTKGQVRIFDADPRHQAARLHLGSTPQASALPETLKVSEVLHYIASQYRIAGATPTPREQIVAEFGLEDLMTRMCGGLSGGQQRRVAVALAFVGDPRLVLLDEPTTGLDVEARRHLWEAVRAKHKSGCTVIVTSHHLEEIEQLAQRVVVINHGQVIADGALDTVVRGVSRQRVTLRGVDAQTIHRLDPHALVTVYERETTALVDDSDALVRALVTSGTPFTHLTVRGASLEEAFLAITNG